MAGRQAALSQYIVLCAVATLTVGSSITFPKSSEPEKAEFTTGEDTNKPLDYGSPETTAYHVANIGLKTLRELVQANTSIIISPLNIYSCLGILGLGSNGVTRKEIMNILGPRSGNQSLAASIRSADGVSYASALFLDRNLAIKREFADKAAAEFLASPMSVDLTDSEQAKSIVNRWVADQTNGTINDLLQGSIDPHTKMIVVTALLFNGKWLQSFSPSATTIGKFTVDERTSVDVQLMHLVANISVVRNSLLDAIGLPYQDPGMKMYLILPKTHGITGVKKLLSHLNVNSLKKLKSESVRDEVLVIIPKVKVDGRHSLGKAIKQLGILSMFNPSTANFTNMVEGVSDLFVSEIYHSVHFEMNEEGTMASAASASVLTKSSKFVFKATRPFIIVITNDEDLILFMGTVVNP